VISTGDVGVTEEAPPPPGGGVRGPDDVAGLGGIERKETMKQKEFKEY
jgi:hypothetical protein